MDTRLAGERQWAADIQVGSFSSPCSCYPGAAIAHSTATKPASRGGRPSVQISVEQLKFFTANNYTAKKMAAHFGCSTRVVQARLKDAGIKLRAKYAACGKEEVEEAVSAIHQEHPHAGQKMMQGYLRAQGINVQRRRVREALRVVDPEGTKERWATTLKRRQYSVLTPNYLWHLDAHLKLINWGFVTHGCIDGYSRLIVYVKCSLDAEASTPLRYFVNSCANYGVPSHVRTDHGKENKKIALFMNLIRNTGRGSHIAGKSTRNQRIERLWPDVYTQVIDPFYTTFQEMEAEGCLDVDDRRHMTALHFVFLPMINRNLEQFRTAWNLHALRTEHERSPRTVWIDGMLETMNSGRTAPLELFGNPVPLKQTIEAGLARYGLAVEDIPAIPERGDPRVRTTVDLDLSEGQTETLDLVLGGMESRKERYQMAVSQLSDWFP